MPIIFYNCLYIIIYIYIYILYVFSQRKHLYNYTQIWSNLEISRSHACIWLFDILCCVKVNSECVSFHSPALVSSTKMLQQWMMSSISRCSRENPYAQKTPDPQKLAGSTRKSVKFLQFHSNVSALLDNILTCRSSGRARQGQTYTMGRNPDALMNTPTADDWMFIFWTCGNRGTV